MKVSIEVKSGSITHEVSVTAHSIERALQLARGSLPGAEARVKFPIEPEKFFNGGFVPGGTLLESVPPVKKPLEAVT